MMTIMLKVTVTMMMIMSRMVLIHALRSFSEGLHNPEARKQGVTHWRLVVTLA